MIKQNAGSMPYKFQDENRSRELLRDIGTLDAYWKPIWIWWRSAVQPLRPALAHPTYQGNSLPPSSSSWDFQGGRGRGLDSIVCGGCIISVGRVQNSVLSPHVRVHDHADVRGRS